MTVLEAIGDYLANHSQGTLAVDLFLARMPENPDVCVTVFEYEGTPPLEAFGNTASSVDRPRIQIKVRASRDDYPTARDKAQAIRDLVGAISNETISGISLLRVKPLGGILPLGFDQQDRPIVAVNFECFVGR